MKIWIVERSTGEYSDHSEWPVKAFRSEIKARRLVVEAQARANELYAKHKHRSDIPMGSNEFDPDMQTDYTGAHYTCYPIELDETE